ncbi:MAG: methyltransferase family protein [Anaerolineae bacterium]
MDQLEVRFLAEKLGLPHPALVPVVIAAAMLGSLGVALSLPALDARLPGGAITTQALIEVVWLLIMWYGFMGHRQAYRDRYGKRAYLQAVIRFFLPGGVLMMEGIIRPAFLSGPALIVPAVADILGLFGITQGVLLGLRAVKSFGLARAALVYSYFPEEDHLVQSRLYAYLRHPLYAMMAHVAIGIAMLSNNALALGCALIYFAKLVIWSWLEEKELMERFGHSYKAYRRQTPAFFPRIRDLPGFWRTLIGASRTSLR